MLEKVIGIAIGIAIDIGNNSNTNMLDSDPDPDSDFDPENTSEKHQSLKLMTLRPSRLAPLAQKT